MALSGGRFAAALVNRGLRAGEIAVQFSDFGLPAGTARSVRDLWTHQDLGRFTDHYRVNVPPHDVVLVLIQP